MPTATMTADPRLSQDPVGVVIRRGLKVFWIALGFVLVLVGAVGLLLPLPTHLLFLLVVAVGMVMLLRNSRSARKTFIRAHRRHPRFLQPVRRLLRRNAPVLAIVWHSILRTERFLLRRYAFFGQARRGLWRMFRRR